MNLTEQGLRLLAASPIARHTGGHAHFWERALSRRHFLAATGLAGGAVVTSSAWLPVVAEAAAEPPPPGPIPIPYGTTIAGQLFHFQFPVANTDVSSIFDFKGLVGVADINGPGTGIHDGKPLVGANFGSDNRFMKGQYVGADGERHRGTFAFI
jgi:hypothetical protein